MSKAETVAGSFKSRKVRHELDDLKGLGLPKHVQDAILDVEYHSHLIEERVAAAEALFERQPEHPLALDPESHAQTSWAQRFEEVDGEIVEITKESADSPVKVVYRPDLVAGEQVDPAAFLEASFRDAGEHPVEG